jgi:hypothetical protein
VLALGFRIRASRSFLAILMLATMADLLGVFAPLMRSYPESYVDLHGPLVAPLRRSPFPTRILAPGRFTNNVMHHGLCSASGTTGNTLGRYNNFANRVLRLPLDTPQTWDPFVQFLPALAPLAIEWEILPTDFVKPELQPNVRARAEGFSLIRITESSPRAWLATAPVAVSNESEALDNVMTLGHDPLRNPVIERSDAGITPAPLRADEWTTITSFSPNRVELEANASRPRVLVLSEMYEKNWTARVNDKPAEVFAADYLLRGIVIPARSSHVIFEYRPASFRVGAAISGISLVLVLAFAGITLRKRREI